MTTADWNGAETHRKADAHMAQVELDELVAQAEAAHELAEAARLVLSEHCPCNPTHDIGACPWLTETDGSRQLTLALAAYDAAAGTPLRGPQDSAAGAEGEGRG